MRENWKRGLIRFLLIKTFFDLQFCFISSVIILSFVHDLKENLILFSIMDIRRIPSKIGIAGSARKAEAVIGAIRGGYLNILITDTECAKKLIELANVK